MLGIATLSIMMLSKMTLCVTTLYLKKLSLIPLVITTLITNFSIAKL
jgi:hypothetical protein